MQISKRITCITLGCVKVWLHMAAAAQARGSSPPVSPGERRQERQRKQDGEAYKADVQTSGGHYFQAAGSRHRAAASEEI